MNTKQRAAVAVLGVFLGALAGGACIALDQSSKGATSSTTAAADLGDAVAATDGDDAVDSSASGEWLFSHTSERGTITPTADGGYVLTLQGIDAHVVAFTDRPDRKSEILDVDALVMAWPSLFAESAPNGVLVEHEPTGDTDSTVLELSNPRLDGTTLTFDAKVLEVEDDDGTSGVDPGRVRATPPATFDAASLFIDDVDMGGTDFDCVDGSGNHLNPPGPVPLVYRPAAGYAALCTSLGGTVVTD